MVKGVMSTVVVTLLLFVGPNANGQRSNADRCISTQADQIFAALRPLTKTCSRVGPASARWYMNASIWNDFSHDEQQQLMDSVASRQAIHDARVTIHIYVHSTKVGEIGPGWTGDWKFRRKKN